MQWFIREMTNIRSIHLLLRLQIVYITEIDWMLWFKLICAFIYSNIDCLHLCLMSISVTNLLWDYRFVRDWNLYVLQLHTNYKMFCGYTKQIMRYTIFHDNNTVLSFIWLKCSLMLLPFVGWGEGVCDCALVIVIEEVILL